jgi:hypothetical protein
VTVRPNGKLVDLETLGDVVQMLNPKEVRRRGVEEQVFTDNGLMISAVSAGLNARGYETEIIRQGGGPAAPTDLHAGRSRQAARRRSSPTLRARKRRPQSLRGRSMSGREMYERLCELRLESPDWWELTSTDREAWDRLADDVIADIQGEAAA